MLLAILILFQGSNNTPTFTPPDIPILNTGGMSISISIDN